MSKIQKFVAMAIIMAMAILPMYNVVTVTVAAADGIRNTTHINKSSGWTPNDSGIYNTPTDIAENESSIESQTDDREISFIEKMLSGLVVGVAYGVNWLEEKAHMTIPEIVYGRVCGYGVGGTTYYHFELAEDNPYGYIAALLYATFRGIAIVLIICILMSKLTMATVTSTGRARENLKNSLSNYAIVMALLYLMPYLLDLAQFVMNNLLHAVAKTALSNFGTVDFYEAFNGAYESSPTFLNAILVLGAVVYALFLAFVYVSVAMGMTVLFIIFPFVCVTSSFDKDALMRWCKEALGYMIIPSIDAALLMIPLMMGKIGSNMAFLQFIVCMMIVPARQTIRSILGLGSSTGLDRAGLMGAMGAMALGRAAIRGGAKMAGAVKEGGESIQNARREKGLANAEADELKDAEDQMYGRNGYDGAAVTRLPLDMGMSKGKQKRAQKSLDEYNGMMKTADENDKRADELAAQNTDGKFDTEIESLRDSARETREGANALRSDKLSNVEEFLKSKTPEGSKEKDHLEGTARVAAAQGVGISDVDKDIMGQRNEQMEDLVNQNNALDERKKDLNLNNAKIRKEMELGSKDKSTGLQEIADNNVQIAEIDKQSASNSRTISAIKEESQYVDGVARSFGTTSGNVAGGRGTGSVARVSGSSGGGAISSERLNNIELRYANAKNFDSGAFTTLTHQQKADLYKKRTIRQTAKLVGGTVGGVAGATVGIGATTFFSAPTKAVGVMAGVGIGSAAGRGIAHVATVGTSRTLEQQVRQNVVYQPASAPVDVVQNVTTSVVDNAPTARTSMVNVAVKETVKVASGVNTVRPSLVNAVKAKNLMADEIVKLKDSNIKSKEEFRTNCINKLISQIGTTMDSSRLVDACLEDYKTRIDEILK